MKVQNLLDLDLKFCNLALVNEIYSKQSTNFVTFFMEFYLVYYFRSKIMPLYRWKNLRLQFYKLLQIV